MLILGCMLLCLVAQFASVTSLNTTETSSGAGSSSTSSVSGTVTALAALATEGRCDSCTIHGGEVQVYWWPTASDGQQIKTIEVDAAGFTFLSPSIYVAFSTLYTANACSTGDNLPATTLAFPQDALSTATGWRWNTAEYVTRPPRVNSVFILATWVIQQIQTCTYVTTSFWQPKDGKYENNTYTATTGTDITFTPDAWEKYTVSYNPCSPTLSAPPQVFTIEPAWANCVRGIDGFFDPPSALQVATMLTTASPAPVVAVPTAPSAAAGSTVAPVTIAPTSSPAVVIPVQDPTLPGTPAADAEPTTSPVNDPLPTTNRPVDPALTTPSPTTSPYLVIGTQTLSTGQPSITIPGTLVSLSPEGSSIIIGTSTLAVSSFISSISSVPTYLVGSQTIKPGGSAITIIDSAGSRNIISLLPGTSSVVVGGSTIAVSQLAGFASATKKPSPASSIYLVGSQTITAGGPAITLTDSSGASSVISLEAGASSVIVGGSTIPVAQLTALSTIAASTSTQPFGWVIASIGGYFTASPTVSGVSQATNSGGFNGTEFTGAGTRIQYSSTWRPFSWLGILWIITIIL